jgi:hypothetical protein
MMMMLLLLLLLLLLLRSFGFSLSKLQANSLLFAHTV